MKKKTPARPAAKKKAAPKKTRSRKLAAKPAARKPRKAAPAKAKVKKNPVAAQPVKPAAPAAPLSLPVHLPLHAEPGKPGLHLPMKPAPAYAHMIERAWAHRPPPHKLTK